MCSFSFAHGINNIHTSALDTPVIENVVARGNFNVLL